MAGGVVDPDVKNYAYESGFFVLELTGESVHLIPPPDRFEPKKWQPGNFLRFFDKRASIIFFSML
jgi:hypothetical protein